MIQQLLGRLIAAIATRKMLVWAMEYVAKKTDNNLDDDAVKVVAGALENDAEKMQEGAKGLLEQATDAIKN